MDSIRKLLLVAPLSLALACSADPDGDDATRDPVAGVYLVTTTYDLSQSEALPEIIGDALGSLTGLADDPAGTLIELLEAADIPVLDQLLSAIPSSLRGELVNWINEYIFGLLYQGVPVTEELVRWADDLATLLTHFEVESELELARASADGLVRGSHALAGVAFELRGAPTVVDSPFLLTQLTRADEVEAQLSVDGAAIEIADHAFHLPLGDFAVTGVNLALSDQLGVANLRGLLGLYIDCAALADNIASRCIGPVCVGHEAEIEAFCDAGLSQVAALIEARIASIDFAALHMREGRATLGAGAGEIIDRMDNGSWRAAADLDGRELPIGASFLGRRAQ